jgi:beta-aspartyl-peptidase (threonine type)
MENKKYAIAIHGGAGILDRNAPQDIIAMWHRSLKNAIEKGLEELKNNKTCVDAVEAAIMCLEDDPIMNAGKGAVFNNEGEIELDASIMRGEDAGCGAVAGVRTVRHPIALARLVMEKSPHVMLMGKGADKFARFLEIEEVGQDYFYTEHRYKQWQAAVAAGGVVAATADCSAVTGSAVTGEIKAKKGTVGAVARDVFGNLAAGTSTGGLTNKKFGRIGDTPVIGAGTYANNLTCAVSCTGNGEEFIRYGIARDVHNWMFFKGLSAEEAANKVIHEGKLQPDDGGLIVVDKDGNIAYACNADVLFRAGADSDGKFETLLWM